MKKLIAYFDMDGVLADFDAEPDGKNRFAKERGFFYNLKPMTKNVKAVREAIRKGEIDAYIISASLNDRTDCDKRRWLNRYIPEIDMSHVIQVRIGENKAYHMQTEYGCLFDDYNRNIMEWCLHKLGHNRAVRIKRDGDVADGLKAVRVLKNIVLN